MQASCRHTRANTFYFTGISNYILLTSKADYDTHAHTLISGDNVFLLMISGQRLIIFATVGVRTSISEWKPPIVAPQQDRKHLSQQSASSL